MNTKIIQMIKVFFITAIPLLLYFFASKDISPEFPLYLALTSMAIVTWATNAFPAIAVAALLTFAYTLFGVASPEVVFGPWTTVLPWITFAAVVIGDAMEETGLARRCALQCLKYTGNSFHGLVLGFFIAGLVVVFILPSIMGRIVIFCALAVGVIQALQLDPKSRMSSTIILIAFFAASAPNYMYLHSSESFIWAFDMMAENMEHDVDFWEYAYHGTFVNLIYYMVSMATVYIVKGKETLSGDSKVSDFIRLQLQEMGPLSTKEIKLSIIVGGVIIGFMLEAFSGLNAAYIFGILAIACYMPGIDILKGETFDRLQIMFIIMITGCMAIGFVGGSVGANKWAVESITPLLTGWGDTMSVLWFYVAGVVMNFLLTPLAAMAAFTPAIGDLGTVMNMNPLPLFYSFYLGLDQYIFPYEAVFFLYIFVTKHVQLKHIMVALAARMFLTGLLMVLVAVPYWRLIGIM